MPKDLKINMGLVTSPSINSDSLNLEYNGKIFFNESSKLIN